MVNHTRKEFVTKKSLTLLITSGPTQEPIDPVRFISNYSTGAMGHAIAQEALSRGYSVIYITGPTALEDPAGAKVIHVQTAQQMHRAVMRYYGRVQAVVMASAVSDYRPIRVSPLKIDSSKKERTLRLVENPDILEALGRHKANNILVGFALQTHGLKTNALAKLRKKNLDCIVANQCGPKCPWPFGRGKTNLLLLFKDGKQKQYRAVTKPRFAGILLDNIQELMLVSKLR